MKQKLVSLLVLCMLVVTVAPIMGAGGDAEEEPLALPNEMLIWEAYAKGYVKVIQQYDASFKVTNSASIKVKVDENSQLLSPSPLDVDPPFTTQDGLLTPYTIPAKGSVTYTYGDPTVVGELPPPNWWCTEAHQATLEDVPVTLGGEVVPYDIENLLSLPKTKRQKAIWDYQDVHAVVVVGKTPLWNEIPDDTEREIDIQLAVTNTGFVDIDDVLVIDTMLPGYSYDPDSFDPQPDSIEVDPDYNTIFKWYIDLDSAQDTGSLLEPTIYDTEFITYTIKTPELSEDRYFQPRAFVDEEDDGTADAHSARPLLEVYHVNKPPVANAGGFYYIQEGTTATFDASGSYDPEGDPLEYRWDLESDGIWDTGWLTVPTLDVDYGDDLSGMLKLEVTDGLDTSADFAYYIVENLAPAVSLSSIAALSIGDEGDTFSFKVRAEDPGSDDLTYTWSGHCTGWPSADILYPNDPLIIPDPYPSPDMNPRDVTDTQTIVCGDDGMFQWEVQVEDDDGGSTTLKGTFQVDNLPPSLTVSPPSFVQIDEGVTLTMEATASDPGSDDLYFTWDWDYGPTVTNIYYNDGTGPDPLMSPEGTFPFTMTDSSTHTYGDDCMCNVSLKVEDDDGGSVTYITNIEVHNAPPAFVGNVKAYATGDLTLRVAGEKWHDVELRLYDNGVGVGVASVTRYPGSPDRQSVTIRDVVIELFNGNLVAVVEYTPWDDPISGTINGANPAWLIFTPHGGGEAIRLHHTFNVRHPETWVWTVADFFTYLVGVNITFETTASDPGSDDLTFVWDLGDGTLTQHEYCNSAQCPDPYPSPEVNPMEITDKTVHRYDSPGIYTTTLKVSDDDGGEVAFSKDIQIGGE